MCGGCRGDGCVECKHLGFTLCAAKAKVDVPHEWTEGEQITIAKKGDELPPDGHPVDLIVELTSDPVRVAALEAKDATWLVATEKALTQHHAQRVLGTKQKRQQKMAIGVLAIMVLAVCGALLYMHANEHDLGESCRYDNECGSRHCLLGVTAIGLVDHEHAGYCSDLCEKDSDCPRTMKCGEARSNTNFFDSVASHGQAAKACVK
jgi:hypothetical protein